MNESDKIKECIAEIMTWMREPDYADEASLEWLLDWVNRRPIAELGMVAVLMPAAVGSSSRVTDGERQDG